MTSRHPACLLSSTACAAHSLLSSVAADGSAATPPWPVAFVERHRRTVQQSEIAATEARRREGAELSTLSTM